MPEWGKKAFDAFYGSVAERWGHPGSRQPVTLHYHDFNILQWQRSRYAPMLAALLGIKSGDGVIMTGCGFNATAEGLTALGAHAIGVDTSAYINREKDETEEAEIRAACLKVGLDPDTDTVIGPPGNADVNPLDLWLRGGRASPWKRGFGTILMEDMQTARSRNMVINRFNREFPGASIRFVITEETLNSITDDEALAVCDACQAASAEWGASIVHMLSPLQKDRAQASMLNWKTYAEWRAFLAAGGFQLQGVLPTVSASGQGMSMPSTSPSGCVDAYAGVF